MMRIDRPRVLFIGCGNIAGRFDMARPADALPVTQAGAFLRHGGFDLSACVDPDEEVRQAFAQHWSIPRHAASLDLLCARLGEFDVIGLCSPTALHHVHLQAALALKPRVIFCEKPLTASLGESLRWEKACVEQNVCLVVNYTRQWDPSVASLLAELSSGRWGRIRSAVGYYNKGVFNNGGHLIDLLMRLLGPLTVIAAGAPVHDHWDQDPTVPGLLVSQEGAVPIALAVGHAKDYALFELELVCEHGVVRMRNGGMQWEVRHAESSSHFRGYRALSGTQTSDGNYPQAMSLAVAEIHDHLTHGTPTRSSGAHAVAVQTICDKLLSAATAAASSLN